MTLCVPALTLCDPDLGWVRSVCRGTGLYKEPDKGVLVLRRARCQGGFQGLARREPYLKSLVKKQ